MRVLITGNQGYLGTVTAEVFSDAGHEVTGLDSGLFAGCVVGPGPLDPPTLATDLRDVTASDLTGFDAVVHLAALPAHTRDAGVRDITRHVNHLATVRLARAAKAAGVGRFLFASTCSVYGTRRDEPVHESAALHPINPYAQAKARAEEGLAGLAEPGFVPVFLRLATAYGFSPRLRSDLLLNHMVGDAVFTGRVQAPAGEDARWPMVHVRDAAEAFLLCLAARPEVVECAAFNVGSEAAMMSGAEIARTVVEEIPGVTLGPAGTDPSSPMPCRVDFEAIRRAVGFEARWGIADGVVELHRAYAESGLDSDTFFARFSRRNHLNAMRKTEELNDDIRRQEVLV